MGTKEALEILNSTKVGFNVYTTFHEFGHVDALISWFDTICYRLEDGVRGSRFPLLKKLYDDEYYGVLYEELDAFKLEIETVQNELGKLPISQAIWDIANPKEKIPKNHPNINYNAKNLAELQEIFRLDTPDFGIISGMEFNKSNCFILKTNKLFDYDRNRTIVDGVSKISNHPLYDMNTPQDAINNIIEQYTKANKESPLPNGVTLKIKFGLYGESLPNDETVAKMKQALIEKIGSEITLDNISFRIKVISKKPDGSRKVRVEMIK